MAKSLCYSVLSYIMARGRERALVSRDRAGIPISREKWANNCPDQRVFSTIVFHCFGPGGKQGMRRGGGTFFSLSWSCAAPSWVAQLHIFCM